MPKNKMLEKLMARFQEILDVMDELSDCEELEEINAQFEDTLFLMESIDPDEEDASEEMEGALEELEDILDQYREMDDSKINQKALELEMAISMARNNL